MVDCTYIFDDSNLKKFDLKNIDASFEFKLPLQNF